MRLTLQKVIASLMFCGSLAATSCGGAPGAQEICDAYCDKQASCNSWTADQRSSCKNVCKDDSQNGSDNVQQAKDLCKNSDAVIDADAHCFTSYCSQTDINDCLSTAAGKCEAK